jgi:dihydroflavonol-4-reductase
VRALRDLSVEVVALARPERDVTGLERRGAIVARGDLLDAGSLRAAAEGCHAVFHCAAFVSFDRRDETLMQRINVEGTRYLVQACRDAGVQRLIHTSTISAIGRPTRRGEILDERAAYNFGPLRLGYCDTKHQAERVVLEEGVARGLDAVIVNPSVVYGPGDRRKAADSVLARVAQRRPLIAPPGGANAVDVNDVVSGHLLAWRKGKTGERYILGGENLTHRRLLEKICAVLGQQPPVATLPKAFMFAIGRVATWLDPLWHFKPPATAGLLRLLAFELFYSSEKAATELGYASYPIEMAIKATFDWMLDTDQVRPDSVRALGRL